MLRQLCKEAALDTGILRGRTRECQVSRTSPHLLGKNRTHDAARRPVKNGFPEKGEPGVGRDLSEPSTTDLLFSPTGLSGQLLAERETEKRYVTYQVPSLAASTIIWGSNSYRLRVTVRVTQDIRK